LHWVVWPKELHNRILLFGSIDLKHGHHFDYWNQPLNMSMHVCYPDCHEAGLCHYLMIPTENLLHPLQLFYFHLWLIYWLSFVHNRKYSLGNKVTRHVNDSETLFRPVLSSYWPPWPFIC
jgi:hypothetical protein